MHIKLFIHFLIVGLFISPVFAKQILVGVSAALTGPSQKLGQDLLQGSEAYFKYINAKGGIHGQPIKLIIYDDQYNPKLTIQNTIQLIEKDKVDLLFGYTGTPTVTRILPLLKFYNNTYLFFPFTGAEPQRTPPYNNHTYNLRASYLEEVSGLVQNFIKLNRKRIAIFYQADAYGRNGWDGVYKTLAKNNLSIVGEASYTRGSRFQESFQVQAGLIQKADPDAIIIIGSYEASAGFIRDIRDLGVKAPIANISFVGSNRLLSQLQALEQESGKNYTENLINSQVVPFYKDKTLPATREYHKLMKKAHAKPAINFVSFEGFLNAKLLVSILKETTKPFSTAQISPILIKSKTYDIGIYRTIQFNKSNQGLHRVYYTTIKKGRYHPLKDWKKWKK
ncbi:ABC transporter substrate-binding protein [Candidatus Marinamargulisbacteria bacterium SCGC AG-439-L15]|nr:ABC transporter substrate-binding protein [Candidatus Marinamargulisbacteria bacterium SCGC AG-439-L15]